MRKPHYFLTLLLAAVLAIGAAVPASAVDAGSDDGTLEVSYLINETPAADVEFSIYRVGEHAGAFRFEWAQEYAEYQLKMDMDNAQELAQTLASYAMRDGKEAFQTSKTLKSGIATFHDIPDGLYLVVGAITTSGSYRYTPIPTLVFFPFTGEDGLLSRDVDVTAKYESQHIPNDSNSISRKAVKLWEGDDENERPKSITVQLLRDGKEYKEAELSETNGWRIIWTGLSSRYEWTVVEKDVPEGYTASVKRDNGTFIITNEKGENPSPMPTPVPTPEPEPTPSPEPVPTPNPTPEPSPSPTPTQPDKLPQTGQNWTSAILMAGAGVACFVIGAVLRKRALYE